MQILRRARTLLGGLAVAMVGAFHPLPPAGAQVACTPNRTASLINAITIANLNPAFGTISLEPGCVYTFTGPNQTGGDPTAFHWYGPSALPAIAGTVIIEGNGAIIERAPGSPPFRLFFVGANPADPATPGWTTPGPGNLTLRNLTVRGGLARGGDGFNGGGGGAGMGGAIFSQGRVLLDGVTLSGNTAQGGAGAVATVDAAGSGGGIGTSGTANAGGGFGPGTFGGAVGGPNGTAGGGGAGFAIADNGQAAVNFAGGAGGGPSSGTGGQGAGSVSGAPGGPGGNGSGGGGASTPADAGGAAGGAFGQGGRVPSGGGGVGGGGGGNAYASTGTGGGGGFGGGGGPTRTTFAVAGVGGFGGGGGAGAGGGGSAGYGGGPSQGFNGGGGAGMGGAVFNHHGSVTTMNSTFSGNSAVGGTGGRRGLGLGGGLFDLNGSVRVQATTVAFNTVTSVGGGLFTIGYGAVPASSTTFASSSIFANNTAFDIAVDQPPTVADGRANVASTVADLAPRNLVGVLTVFAGSTTVTEPPLSAVDPQLGPLADNGGPTFTHAIPPTSPAIDAGAAVALTDQRGRPRPFDVAGVANATDGSDIGAFEYQVALGITTQASPGGPVGTAVRDVATVTGVTVPGGFVAFALFSDANCTTVVGGSAVPLVGGTATSADIVPQAPGTYFWVAAYSDSSGSVTSPCQAQNESVTITKASPTIATQASPENLVGAPVRDTATVSGGFNPTGTVTFRLYSDDNCAIEVFNSTVPVGATSNWFTPSAPGTYRWRATYNGDANNNAVTAPCNAQNESVTITPFVAPAYTRTISGDLVGPLTIASGESVLVNPGSRIAGPITVQPGGSLTMNGAAVTRGVVVDNPRFLSICGTSISGPSPGVALSVTNATVPIRIGDPATGCAGNRFAGQVNLTANLAVAFGANQVSHTATVTNGGPGQTVIKANLIYGTLACSGNNPAPTNAGQPNTAGAKTGQCVGL